MKHLLKVISLGSVLVLLSGTAVAEGDVENNVNITNTSSGTNIAISGDAKLGGIEVGANNSAVAGGVDVSCGDGGCGNLNITNESSGTNIAIGDSVAGGVRFKQE